MKGSKFRRWGLVIGGTLLILGIAGLLGVGGCGSSGVEKGSVAPRIGAAGLTTTAAGVMTTAAGAATASGADATQMPLSAGAAEGEGRTYSVEPQGADAAAGLLTALEKESSAKVISDAQLEIQVEIGKFQSAFDQALLIADRYGGYVVSSTSQAGGEDSNLKSGTIAIRVPAASFTRALSDAAKLGQVKSRQ
ncbi:MAG: DUF4349 domain-containing protein, partial [Thermoleophilia bacterium]|nr:DUF4349 domain-containing protein [Thermoleophilia bacterium]